jgi:flagellar biosynthesis regulator FlaF
MLSVATLSVPHAPLQRPTGALAAYGAVIRSTEDPRTIEYRVLARAASMLELAALPGAGPADLPSAIHENRLVWTAFAADLIDEENACENSLRAGLLSLTRWVFAESDRVLRARKNPQALIDVNRAVMLGLQPDTAAQPDPL